MDAFEEGNNLLLDADVEGALEAFERAIAADGSQGRFHSRRSACLYQLGRYPEALEAAGTATRLDPRDPSGFQRKAMACFKLEEFESGLQAAESGLEIDPKHRQLLQWKEKCAKAIALDDEDGLVDAATPAATEAPEAGTPLARCAEPEAPRVRHSWYQSATAVYLDYFLKQFAEEKVQATYSATSMTATFDIGEETPFVHEVHFSEAINPDACRLKVGKVKVEIMCPKVVPAMWADLEPKPDAVATSYAVPEDGMNKHVYPSSSSKKVDWSAVGADEPDEELSGDAALQKVFQDIYGKGSDEQRRAMMKSFVESGGTVLSTNWEDVGKKKVEVSPPTGMEAKSWSASE